MTDTPNIITSAFDGETYDLTKNSIRWDLLPVDVQEAIMSWPHGWSRYEGDGRWVELPAQPSSRRQGFLSSRIYRARPAPKVTEHVLCWRLGDAAAGSVREERDTHKITIHHIGNTLPFGTYPGPDGATITMEEAK